MNNRRNVTFDFSETLDRQLHVFDGVLSCEKKKKYVTSKTYAIVLTICHLLACYIWIENNEIHEINTKNINI